MSIERDHFEAFTEAFDAVVREQLDEADLTAVLWSDGDLQWRHETLDFAQSNARGGPWGQHFPEPLFHGDFASCSNGWSAKNT